MGKIAFVFSGQGDQYPGMGKELSEKSPAARKVFELCDRLRPGTSDQCFFGSKEDLQSTVNTQPCLFAMELALAQALRENRLEPDVVAGFSLGEVTACTFADAFDYETGFSLVMQRGRLMHEASFGKELAMHAILRLPSEVVEEICGLYEDVYPVNYNGPGQVVIAGKTDSLEKAAKSVKAAGGRTMKLPVSGAFHTPYMQAASEGFQKLLEHTALRKPKVPIYSNVTAKPYPEDFGPLLAEQIQKPVRWEALVREMGAAGVTTFIEIGPGRTLSNLIKRIIPEASIYAGTDLDKIRDEVIKC